MANYVKWAQLRALLSLHLNFMGHRERCLAPESERTSSHVLINYLPEALITILGSHLANFLFFPGVEFLLLVKKNKSS